MVISLDHKIANIQQDLVLFCSKNNTTGITPNLQKIFQSKVAIQ